MWPGGRREYITTGFVDSVGKCNGRSRIVRKRNNSPSQFHYKVKRMAVNKLLYTNMYQRIKEIQAFCPINYNLCCTEANKRLAENNTHAICPSLLITLPRVLVNLEIVVVRDDHSLTHDDCPSAGMAEGRGAFECCFGGNVSCPACFPFLDK